MNIELLREHLAIKTMGAKVIEGRKHKIYDFPSGELTPVVLWKPDEYDDQAKECLETFDVGWCVKTYRDNNYSCRIGSHEPVIDKSELMAISLACARATGWKDE